MKQLEKSDLKIGEIYKNVNGDTIFLCQSNKKNYGDGFRISTKIFARNNYFDRFGIDLNFLEATPEEKHWLETCIKADKFVSYEEAIKTFIPEYVKCVISMSESYVLNKIYKVKKDTGYVKSETGYHEAKWNNEELYQSTFKPSTKEAAEEYIIMNKPCLSINDILNHNVLTGKKVEHLEKLVQQKLNK